MLRHFVNSTWNRAAMGVLAVALSHMVTTSAFAQEILTDLSPHRAGQATMHGIVQSTDLRMFGDTSTVLDGAAMLHATPNHISATIHATGLDASAVYTVWGVVFNQPHNCTAGTDPRPDVACGSGDLSLTPNMADASAFHVGGFITTGEGTGHVNVQLHSGSLPMGADVLWGLGGLNDNGVEPGLMPDNGLLAEIHFVLRSHGPIITGQVAEQISTLNGGCPPNACSNQQAASFPPAALSQN